MLSVASHHCQASRVFSRFTDASPINWLTVLYYMQYVAYCWCSVTNIWRYFMSLMCAWMCFQTSTRLYSAVHAWCIGEWCYCHGNLHHLHQFIITLLYSSNKHSQLHEQTLCTDSASNCTSSRNVSCINSMRSSNGELSSVETTSFCNSPIGRHPEPFLTTIHGLSVSK